MGVYVMIDGQPVVLDTRLWSWDETIRPVAANSYVGSDLLDPVEVWRTQRAVRTVVGFLARNIAQVALHAFTTDTNGDRVRLDARRTLPRLLKDPSPVTTAYDAMHQLVTDVCLFDRHASRILIEDGRVVLRRMPPNTWHYQRAADNTPTKIITYSSSGERRNVALGDVLWFDGYPTAEGSSPMTALANLLAEERESSNYRRELWEGGARFPGWIERPADAPSWAVKDQSGTSPRDRFRTGWQDYASGGLQVGKTPILEDGMTYHELAKGITPEDAQQLESRKFSIAEVAAFFYVPPVFVGLLDNANYSNVTAYREILYADTLGPWFQLIQQVFNARLLPHPAVIGTANAFVEFNVAEKLRMSFDQQAAIFQTAAGGPFMTRSEVRRRMNLPYLPAADELIVPLNVIEGGQASPTDSGSQNRN